MTVSESDVIEHIELSSDLDSLDWNADVEGDRKEASKSEVIMRDARLIERDKVLLKRKLSSSEDNFSWGGKGFKKSTFLNNPNTSRELLIGYIGPDEPLISAVACLYLERVKQLSGFSGTVKLIPMKTVEKTASVLKRCSLDILVLEACSVKSGAQERQAMSSLLLSFFNKADAATCPLVVLLGDREIAELNDSYVSGLTRVAFRVLKKSTDPRRIAQTFDSAIKVL